MKPVQRLNKDSLAILEQYDTDADKAIFLMQIKLKDSERQRNMLQNVTKPVEKPLQNVTTALQNVTAPMFGQEIAVSNVSHDAAFWKKLSETVDSCIERAKRY